ncbi:hypothetical protein [Sphingobacterium sp.]|uniref:hypothetical protein n=1 Tax=Sphingobacterium sp. TaxID=341027 RepID=UPI00258B2E83|nr:hypothetical protein [Sphingobacterium sp.]WET68787.1 MAG: hypothetical protein P0Y57_23400 [Sphingobacterium sp.]
MRNLRGYFFSKINLNNTDDPVRYIIKALRDLEDNFIEGFQLIDFFESGNRTIRIEILKRSPTYLLDYDEGSRSLLKRETFIFSQASFEIDFNHNILITSGGMATNAEVKTFIRRLLGNINVFPLSFNILKLYGDFQSKDWIVLLKAISIRKFNYKNGLVGRFSGQIVDTIISDEILKEYNKDILKATLELNNRFLQFDLQIFPNGAIKILADAENQEEILDYLKIDLLEDNGGRSII